MKNLVKQAKSNQWKSIVYGSYVFITLFYIMLRISILPYYQTDTVFMIVINWMLIIMVALISMMFGLSVHHLISGKIWKKVKKLKNELTLNRHFHHLRMMEKYIELGDKLKSELLFDQYISSKYWDQNCASFFSGAIRSKFYPKLEFKITHNGKEL